MLVHEAPGAVRDLIGLGVSFDVDRSGELSLGLEGGHSQRRIVHAGGAATGRRIIRQLSAVAAQHPEIEVIERRSVVRILTDADGRVTALKLDDGAEIDAPAVVVATGGAAAMWARTTNPAGAIGGGLVLAHYAGARLADLELMQFHPTAVVGDNGADGFLVTEAVRGEGAHLLDDHGERFVDELAPRDEVARAVQQRIDASGGRSVGLDMRHVDPALFPNVVGALKRAGIDPERELIPVAPAAHYMMGGIATDLHGRASVRGPLRGRRVLVHGPARRQPARLQLAERVLRVRRPRGGGGPRRRRRAAGRPGPAAERRAVAQADALTRVPGRPLAARRARARCRRAAHAAGRRTSARAADRPGRPGPRGEPRRAPAHRFPERSIRRWTVAT